jgi:nucleotide-binding universal stress UspA family protein
MNVDLLLLGSPDRRPSIAKGIPDLDRLLGESLSDYVRVYAPCPVLMTRISS